MPKKELLSSYASGIPSDFELTREFSTAFELMEHTGKHLYITGNAGTGKSTLLHYFKKTDTQGSRYPRSYGDSPVNIGGATIHLLSLPYTVYYTGRHQKDTRQSGLVRSPWDPHYRRGVHGTSRYDDAIDASLRLNRNRPYEPFGGVQLVLIGDLFQLPPVIERDLEEYFADNYMTPYFFSAKVFSEYVC